MWGRYRFAKSAKKLRWRIAATLTRQRLAALMFACLLLVSRAPAQQRDIEIPEESGNLVHFSYATLLGTGVYRIKDRTVTIFRIPLGFTLREATPEKFGLDIKIPVAVGFYDFEVLEDLVPVGDQLSTISVVPGLQFNFLIRDWRISPSAYLGVGYDMTNSESSAIYGGGISALRPIPTDYPEINFGTALLLSGYIPENGESDYITRWSAGFDAKIPTGWNIGNRNVFIGAHTIGYFYLNRIQFQTIADQPIEITKEIEVGVFIGARPAPEIFGIKINRLGVGYRFSSQVDALVFFAGFPF